MPSGRELARSYARLGELDDCRASLLMFLVPFAVWALASLLVKYSTARGMLPAFVDYRAIRYCCLACLLARELAFGKWDRLAFLGSVVFGFMAYMNVLSGMNQFFDAACFVFAGRNVPFATVAKASFAISISFLAANAACAYAGLIPNPLFPRPDGLPRYHMGFTHPNTGAGILCFAFLAWAYIRGERYCAVDAAAGVAAAALVFTQTNSRTACSVMAFAAIALLVVKHLPERFLRSPVYGAVGVGAVLACCLVSVLLAVFYDPATGWMATLNSALSQRLSLAHAAIERYGIPLLGQNVDVSSMNIKLDKATSTWVPSRKESVIVDCEYVKMLVKNGLPYLCLEVALYALAVLRAFKNGEWNLVAIIACIALFGMTETYAPHAYFNAFIFLLGELFYSGALADPGGMEPHDAAAA